MKNELGPVWKRSLKTIAILAKVISFACTLLALAYFAVRSDRMARWTAAKEFYEMCYSDPVPPQLNCSTVAGKGLQPPPYMDDTAKTSVVDEVVITETQISAWSPSWLVSPGLSNESVKRFLRYGSTPIAGLSIEHGEETTKHELTTTAGSSLDHGEQNLGSRPTPTTGFSLEHSNKSPGYGATLRAEVCTDASKTIFQVYQTCHWTG